MKLKKEYLILVVVIAVLVLYLTVRSTNRNDDPFSQPAKLEKTDITRLVLTDKQNPPVEMVKTDGRWLIQPNGYPVDSVKVNNMLHSITELTLTALVSESGNYERYGLSDSEKVFIQAFKEDAAVRGFSIGKSAPTFQHTFVLLEGDPKVYHARGQLERTFDHSIESLRDKTIFDFDKHTINALSIERKGKALDLSKVELDRQASTPETGKEEKTPLAEPVIEWRAGDGNAVDPNSVARLIDEIDHLMCDAFLEDDAHTKLTDAQWRITFRKAEEEFSLSVYPKLEETADQMPSTASTTPYAFLLQQSRLDNIENHLNKLLGFEAKKD